MMDSRGGWLSTSPKSTDSMPSTRSSRRRDFDDLVTCSSISKLFVGSGAKCTFNVESMYNCFVNHFTRTVNSDLRVVRRLNCFRSCWAPSGPLEIEWSSSWVAHSALDVRVRNELCMCCKNSKKWHVTTESCEKFTRSMRTAPLTCRVRELCKAPRCADHTRSRCRPLLQATVQEVSPPSSSTGGPDLCALTIRENAAMQPQRITASCHFKVSRHVRLTVHNENSAFRTQKRCWSQTAALPHQHEETFALWWTSSRVRGAPCFRTNQSIAVTLARGKCDREE